jgi:hypothetical protein
MISTAITEAITTIAEAEKRFQLTRNEASDFFTAWRSLGNYRKRSRRSLNSLAALCISAIERAFSRVFSPLVAQSDLEAMLISLRSLVKKCLTLVGSS